MSTRVIPPEQWLSYLNNISVLSRRQRVNLELEADDGRKILASDAPLIGITPELKGSAACSVSIEIGEQHDGHTERMTHSALITSKLVVQEDEKGNPKELDICAEDPDTCAKMTTIIRFL